MDNVPGEGVFTSLCLLFYQCLLISNIPKGSTPGETPSLWDPGSWDIPTWQEHSGLDVELVEAGGPEEGMEAPSLLPLCPALSSSSCLCFVIPFVINQARQKKSSSLGVLSSPSTLSLTEESSPGAFISSAERVETHIPLGHNASRMLESLVWRKATIFMAFYISDPARPGPSGNNGALHPCLSPPIMLSQVDSLDCSHNLPSHLQQPTKGILKSGLENTQVSACSNSKQAFLPGNAMSGGQVSEVQV